MVHDVYFPILVYFILFDLGKFTLHCITWNWKLYNIGIWFNVLNKECQGLHEIYNAIAHT